MLIEDFAEGENLHLILIPYGLALVSFKKKKLTVINLWVVTIKTSVLLEPTESEKDRYEAKGSRQSVGFGPG